MATPHSRTEASRPTRRPRYRRRNCCTAVAPLVAVDAEAAEAAKTREAAAAAEAASAPASPEDAATSVTLWWNDDDRELMHGACDLHVHLEPCMFTRQTNELEFARFALKAGYRAAVSKCHHTLNADRIGAVRQQVPGFEMFGAVVLNHFVGGLNPYAVEASIGSGGKITWMPTMHAANHVKTFGSPSYARLTRKWDLNAAELSSVRPPISIFGENAKIKPEVHDILHLVAKSGTILATGHLGYEEMKALIRAARESGVEKVVVTHAEMEVSNLSVEQQVELADMGAYIEHVILPLLPLYGRLSPEQYVAAIKAVGPERTILSTDCGQPYNPHPIEAMRQFVRTLLYKGVPKAHIDLMLKRNPTQLLGLEPLA